MPAKIIERVVADLRTRSAAGGDGAPPADAALLDAFLARGDEAAFAALVQRHGPMVLGVCRRILGHAQDAEDAFQAVFWVLSRKASGIRPRAWIGNWLYGVAVRTALKARGLRRRRREHQVDAMPPQPMPPTETDRDAQAILDEEIERLPAKYRLAVVLCELEGRGRKEAAAQLGVPEGTLSSRLAYARRLLARRLRGRGVTLGGGGMAALLGEHAAQAAVSQSLLTSTIQSASATSPASAAVASLAKGVMTAMLLGKLKKMAAVAVICAAALGLSLGWGAFAAQQESPEAGGGPQDRQEKKTPSTAQAAKDKKTSAPAKDSVLGLWRLLRIDSKNQVEPEIHDNVAGKVTVHIAADLLNINGLGQFQTHKIRIGPGLFDLQREELGEDFNLGTYKVEGNGLHLYFGGTEEKSRAKGPKDALETWTLVRLPSRQEIYEQLDRLQGHWNAVSGEFRGQAFLPRELEDVTLSIENDRWMMAAPKETAQPDAVPRTLFGKGLRFVLESVGERDYVVLKVEGRSAGDAFVLYELRGNKLKVCWDAGWSANPFGGGGNPLGGGGNLGAPAGGFGSGVNLGAPAGGFGNLGGGAPGGLGGLGDGQMNITPMTFKTTFSSDLVMFVLKRYEPKPPQAMPLPGGDQAASPEGGESIDVSRTAKIQVRVTGPAGMKVRLFEAKEEKIAPARFTFAKPGTYRLKLSNIPDRPGKVYYPTIEIPAVTAPHAVAFLANSYVPLEFVDFDAADQGFVATNYCILPEDEDKTDAPVESRVQFSRTRPAANAKMAVLAIVRLGGIDLDSDNVRTRPE
jgi:RNA polymerase sigma factor (sigma-70 family)